MKRRNQLLFIVVLAYCNLVNCVDYITNKFNKYHIQPKAKYTWFDARKECKSRKMDLLTIETAEKSQEIREMLQIIFKGKRIPCLYIGANDFVKARQFDWITPYGRNRFSYSNWEKGEPDNFKRREHCVHMGMHGTEEWNDIHCHHKYGFICQMSDKLI